MEKVLIVKRDGVETPEYKTEGSSGCDLRTREDLIFGPFQTKLVKTGIFIKIPYGYEGQIRIRSSLALRSFIVPNSPGTIDSDYVNEIGVIIQNNSNSFNRIEKDERIAQLVFCKVEKAIFEEVEELPKTMRKGGFGSTNKK